MTHRTSYLIETKVDRLYSKRPLLRTNRDGSTEEGPEEWYIVIAGIAFGVGLEQPSTEFAAGQPINLRIEAAR